MDGLRSEHDAKLDDLLACWHRWQMGFSVVPTSSASPQFRNVRANKAWDTTSDAFDQDLNNRLMQAVECQVYELPDQDNRDKGGPNQAYRSAILANARNLHAGKSVWSSPRLPTDPIERAVVLLEARNLLTRRLCAAGVL